MEFKENNGEVQSKLSRVQVAVITAIFTALITVLATVYIYYNYLDTKGAIVQSYDANSSLEQKLNLIRTELDSQYLRADELNEAELIDAALKGYVEGVGDEYTELLTAKEFNDLEESLSDYVGIGIYVAESTSGEAVILAPVGNDSPAFAAGIKEYDVIVGVNGVDVVGLPLDEVVAKIKGKEGTFVKVTIDRDGEEKTFEVERKNIKVAEITYEILEKDIGYINFDSFTETAYAEFVDAYQTLEKEGAKKLIIDLRDNTGGYVEIAEAIMDLFLDKGQVEYKTVDNKKNEVVTYAQTKKIIDMPVVILTNEYTASASEILTGCLKDHGIATVIGTKTYGKGVIQTVFPILKNSAYLKVTTMKYVTPKNNEINEVGIEPDILIELNKDTLDDKMDNQIKEAVKVLKNK